MSKRETDQANLEAALAVIRERITDARVAHFTTSDQSLYGFVLMNVEFGDGLTGDDLDLTVWDDINYEVDELLEDIDWGGVMNEEGNGNVSFVL